MLIYFDIDNLRSLNSVISHPNRADARSELDSSPARTEDLPIVGLDLLAEEIVGKRTLVSPGGN